jgi:hypothetical protein
VKGDENGDTIVVESVAAAECERRTLGLGEFSSFQGARDAYLWPLTASAGGEFEIPPGGGWIRCRNQSQKYRSTKAYSYLRETAQKTQFPNGRHQRQRELW